MTKLKKWPLLIFDLDGTLIDSAKDLQVSMNRMLKTYDRRQVDLPTLTSHIGDGLIKLVNDFFPEFEMMSKENLEKVDEFLQIYENNLIEHTVLYEGVFDFLKDYPGPKALVTNKPIKPTLTLFNHFQLDQLSWVDIIGGDSLDEKKPSPLPLNHVIQKANYLHKDTWMIGDGRPDMQSALAAGCKKIAVHYGYSKPDELQVFNPDNVLKSFHELQYLVK